MMGLARVPLDVGTCMTAAIALGIAVDNTLHLLHGLSEHGLDATARTTGRAFVITAVVVGWASPRSSGATSARRGTSASSRRWRWRRPSWGTSLRSPAALEALGIDDHGQVVSRRGGAQPRPSGDAASSP